MSRNSLKIDCDGKVSMHRLHSSFSVLRFRMVACLILLFWTCLLLEIVSVVMLLVTGNSEFQWISITLVFLVLILFLMQHALAISAVCPLCHAPFKMGNTCSKHRSARHFFGSYTLRKAASILFKRYFRCIYCGEYTTLTKVRKF